MNKLLSTLIVLLYVVFPLSITCAADDTDNDKGTTLIYGGQTPGKVWNGWGFASPDDPHPEAAPALPPEQLDLVETTASEPRTFSGKVEVTGPMDGVEVGLVSLVGIHWVNKDAYQWQPVSADGSFSITDTRYPDAPKALAVRGPVTPCTFLRYNFAPKEAATNIVLKADAPKKIRLTASGEDINVLIKANYEVFVAHKQFDDKGHPLRRQRLAAYKSVDQDHIDAILPLGEVALQVGCPGFASYYQVVDTRRADHFHFVLMQAGQMKITVLDAQGNAKSGLTVNWLNPNAPLSFAERKTNADGVISQENLVPGTFKINAAGFAEHDIQVAPGKLTGVTLQEGKDP